MASLSSGLRGVTWKSGLQQDNMEFAWSLQLLWILAAQSYSPGERCARVCWLPSATEGDTEDCSATASNPEQMLDKRENVFSLQRNVPASLSKPGPQQLVTTWHSMGLEGLKFSQMKTFLALLWTFKRYQVNLPGQGKEWLQELHVQQAKASTRMDFHSSVYVTNHPALLVPHICYIWSFSWFLLLYKPLQSGSLFCHLGET